MSPRKRLLPCACCRHAPFPKATRLHDEPILAERADPAEEKEKEREEVDVDFAVGGDLGGGTATLSRASDDRDWKCCNGEV